MNKLRLNHHQKVPPERRSSRRDQCRVARLRPLIRRECGASGHGHTAQKDAASQLACFNLASWAVVAVSTLVANHEAGPRSPRRHHGQCRGLHHFRGSGTSTTRRLPRLLGHPGFASPRGPPYWVRGARSSQFFWISGLGGRGGSEGCGKPQGAGRVRRRDRSRPSVSGDLRLLGVGVRVREEAEAASVGSEWPSGTDARGDSTGVGGRLGCGNSGSVLADDLQSDHQLAAAPADAESTPSTHAEGQDPCDQALIGARGRG